MKKIVISEIPLKNFYYFQYLIYGFKILEKKNKIEFKIKPLNYFDLFFLRFYFIFQFLYKFNKNFRKRQIDSHLMKGYYEENNKIIHFCYEAADSPHFYDIDVLRNVDLYFKAQCPIEFKKTGFELTPEVFLLYSEDIFKYINKIKPSMLAPGFGVKNIFSYNKLTKGYKDMFVPIINKKQIIMSYFGSSKGPKEVYSDKPDLFSKESHILGFYKDKLSHPNIKRGLASKIIAKIVPNSDVRILIDANYDVGFNPKKSPLYISMKDFPQHISEFNYNLNISGNRLSIPWRFVHSFTVGTAIITDKLKIKWYLPFETEVQETVEMGYLPVDQVNWEVFKSDILNLPTVDSNQIIDSFHKKWSPEVFAEYIIKTCKNKIDLE
ncbi:MAG: hypothetical protein WCG08_14070, partial [Paludibacter sp.]